MSKWKQRINNVRVIALAHFPFSPAFDTFRLQPLTFLATFHRRVRSREGTDTLLPRNTNEWAEISPDGGLWTFVALHGSFAVSCYVNSNLRTITSLQRNIVLRSYCRFRLCIPQSGRFFAPSFGYAAIFGKACQNHARIWSESSGNSEISNFGKA